MFIRMKNKWTDEFEDSEIIKEVYQIYDEKKGDDIDLWAFTFEGFPYCVTKDMIIAQGDNIEKLCDEFVIFEEYSKKPFLFNGSIKLLKHYIEKMSGLVKLCLGAIWTDKGLIYVAKMKGVLPNGEIDWQLL